MKLYADIPARRTCQILADLVAVCAVVFFVWLGVSLHNIVAALGELGVRLQEVGADFSGTMSDIAEVLAGVPLIGSGIASAFDGVTGAGNALAEVGESAQETIALIALSVGMLVATGPIVLILLVWLVPRLKGARRAGELVVLVRSGAPLDILALRALSRRGIAEVAAVSPDAAGQWRRGDVETIRRLAEIELRHAGLRLPVSAAAG